MGFTFPPFSPSAIRLSLVLSLCLYSVDCVYTTPTKIGQGYRLVSLTESSDGALVGDLLVNKPNTIYGPDIPHLKLYVKHETDKSLRVHITDADKQRWEVPYELLPREKPPSLKQIFGVSSRSKASPFAVSEYPGDELIFTYTYDPFSFSVKRKSNGDTLFNSSSDTSDPYNRLVFKDQYLEISTKLPQNASLYGLGESTKPHGIKLNPYDPHTIYNTDQSAIRLNIDLYGSHPMYMDLRNKGGNAYAHAVLLLNSNGMDVQYTGTSLTYKVIGGVLDFYFFAGPTPLDVVEQYTAFIGRPAAMPYWSLGFHQCRWGYHNLSILEDVVDNYQKAKIPLDVIWNDDDHMDGKKIFTLNPVNYPRPQTLAFLDKIHAQGMKYIVIVDPGISVNNSYGVYQRGKANDVFIKYMGKPYVAQVWPGAVNFPDFLNPKTVQWWVDEIHRFHDLLPVDGLWLDMNEVSNFCTGLCTLPEGRICPNGTGTRPVWTCCLDCKNVPKTKWDYPPYRINASGIEAPLGYKTIATSVVHHDGVLEYDAHSIYGFSETIATHKGLGLLEGNRPFVLTRSTFVGSGHYAAHWTGDNRATWDDLKYSISTMLEFGLYGIPMVGADICGFYPPPSEELCNRWIELGAFYPFSRAHSSYLSPRQELYQWATVAESGRNALGMRYKLLPYLYTLSYNAHSSGAPIARPLFFSFPNLTELYGLSTQFLLGKSVLVSPVLEPGKTEVKAIFPPGTWYNMFDMTQAIVIPEETQEITLDAPLHVINVHLYQNTIIPMQRGGLTTKEARATPFTVVVAFPLGTFDDFAYAEGTLFLDRDEMPEMTITPWDSTLVHFCANVQNGTVSVTSVVLEREYALSMGWVIEKVIVLGVNPMRGSFRLEVDETEVKDTSNVKFSATEHTYHKGVVEGGEGDGGMKKNVMVEISGLELRVGKNFCMTWSLEIKA
ncbi:unnamed protein product [Cuscuta epithymum]|uniref:Alpha-glucosidase n=1 Tax=Cuscuta epithymum TaxID=186058 RepID=A0AAV0GIU8_9ASTE|nr:unnamed protein product [Cuscuta epithymum]CAH9147820.1 unnamed protein product [Cuscuta epithymum]